MSAAVYAIAPLSSCEGSSEHNSSDSPKVTLQRRQLNYKSAGLAGKSYNGKSPDCSYAQIPCVECALKYFKVHADASNFAQGASKREVYEQVYREAEALFEDQRNWVCNLANAASLLWNAYKSLPGASANVNWAGEFSHSNILSLIRISLWKSRANHLIP
jgi:hypothetical protein